MSTVLEPQCANELACVYEVDPLQDSRWLAFLERDPRASIFHHPGWLRALNRTYGYVPVVFTTSAPDERLTNGVAFCRVNSWLTGRRLVSLPFSDHCEPLARPHELQFILQLLQAKMDEEELRYVEFRPLELRPDGEGVCESEQFAFHTIDLRPSAADILKSLHKDSIRRKIQRAEREQLVYEVGNHDQLLKKFFHLFAMTRRRHGLPPTPFRWFTNLVECLGDRAQVRLASLGHEPVAALFTLKFGKAMVYKYGASDPGFNNLGGTPFLFWKAIEDAKENGIEEMDLGRSDLDNEGLIRFKGQLASARTLLSYWRLAKDFQPARKSSRSFQIASQLLAYAPARVQIGIGDLFTKHMG
jgi:CelD/BcsL family acetyltransferase involved in cellulose biosynthesis